MILAALGSRVIGLRRVNVVLAFRLPQLRKQNNGAGSKRCNKTHEALTVRVAVVHDWLYTIGGAERVLREILRCYPSADVFALFDFLTPADRARLGLGAVRTSFLQRMPFVENHHRLFLPLMPMAIEQFDLSGYDLVISSSYAVAKGILTSPDQVHIAYIHSPIRYAWDMQHSYLRESGYSSGLRSMLARIVLHRIRMWDTRTAHG